jgi:O-antigen/teichoic acid export membrane protein
MKPSPASDATLPLAAEAAPGAALESLEGPAIEERIPLAGRSLREHTARGAIINSAFHVGFATLGLAQKVAVAAFLTASEFGLWGLLITTMITLAWLKQVGISDKFIQQDEGDQVAAFQRAFTLELAYTLCFYVVIVAALPAYALIYDRSEIVVPGLVLSLALLGSALHTPIWIAYRQMRFVRQRTLEGVDPIVSTIVMVALAAGGAGYWSLVIGTVAGSVAGATVAVATCPYPLAWRFDRATLREYVGFSWPLLLSSASSLLVVQGTIIVGNYTVGLAGLGALALASNFSMFADKIDTIIRRTIYPAVCAVKDRTALLFEAFTKSNRLALIWALPFGAGLALFGPDLVTYVLGERWREAEGLLQAFGLIIAARQIAFNWVIFFSAVGNTRPMAVNGALQVAVFLVVTMPLMLTLGLTGYAIGVATSVVAEIALRGYYLSNLFRGFRLLPHVGRSLLPVIPPVAGVLLIRLAEWGARSPEQVLAELTLYLGATAATLVLFERRLLAEFAGYLAGRPRPPAEAASTEPVPGAAAGATYR